MRAELLRHIEADNGAQPAAEYCDKHGGYVDEGRTRPMATGSPFRICEGCITEAHRRLQATEGYCERCSYLGSFHLNGRCPTENQARAAAGDR